MTEMLRTLVARLLKIRYAKFGIVGASGTVVNMVVLYVAQELLFDSIAAPRERLYVSLALAIFIATINNFSWNRLWTWADRQASTGTAGTPAPSTLTLFAKYLLASWLGIALQYGLTLWLAHYIDYRYANLLAIVLASVSNFIANDRWTFRKK
jgi:putative flippase GtrA